MVSKVMDVLQAVDNSSRERRWKGVRKRAWGRYVCEIRLPRSRQRIWLGSYATAEEAAYAYDAASLCLRGTTASLNFPSMSSLLFRDSVTSQLPMSREVIQSIAAAAAAQCRNPQPNAPVAEKLPSTVEEQPLSSPLSSDRLPKCAKEHSIKAWQGSPISSGPYTPNQSEETSHWVSRTNLRKRAQEEADEPQVQTSSVPAEQSSGPEEILTSATGTEDDQCLFSILKELIALPMICNAYGASIY